MTSLPEETRTGPGMRQGGTAGMPESGLTEEAVEWGFRLLAGRKPVNAQEFASFKGLPDLDAMRRAFTNLGEFHAFFDAVMTGYPAWSMPLFLLRAPASSEVPWRFAPPSLEQPVSQLCTAAQYDDPAYLEILAAMGLLPAKTRALWEQGWVVSMLASAGMVAPGRRGLAIRPGRERVAALLASRGVAVVGAAPEVETEADATRRRMDLFYPEIVHIEDFDRLVGVMRLEPQVAEDAAPPEFDFCWSFDMPARLGSVEAALGFFEESLQPVRPGGLALHCFSLNLTSNTITWELPGLVVLRRSDIEKLALRLHAAGHRVIELNTHPGTDTVDEWVKTDQAGAPGHRQRHGTIVAGSFGLAIRKGG